MKLLSKFNRVNVLTTVIVLLLSGICYYFLISAVLIHQLDKDLKVEEQEVKDFVKQNNRLPEPPNYKDLQELFMPSDSSVVRNFSTVDIYDDRHHEFVSYRQLQFYIAASGKGYNVLVRKSEKESEDIIELILKITFALLLLLLVTLFLINRFILSKLWKPFYTTLQQLSHFNLSGKNKIKSENTNIDEFRELNTAVSSMINRVSQDYNEIKSFTENASHEIQTPLAIIKSKLELLSQAENLKEEQMNTLQSIHEAVNRLSKLNQSLILLTKIDNQQFSENEEVNLSTLINDDLSYYEELVAAKNISLTKKMGINVKLIMNETLASILVSNLITNAIKHNIDNGSIGIALSNTQLCVSNTGVPPGCDPMELFERFKKVKVTSESLGLGLSIVKKICERYHFSIIYSYSDAHTITINFSG
ncbi:MAG: HAMP domain-containing sensor histidine kinase [Ginsengibacter sp.]